MCKRDQQIFRRANRLIFGLLERRFFQDDLSVETNKSTTVRHKFTSDGQIPDDLFVLQCENGHLMRTSAEFVSQISAPIVSTSFDFRDVVNCFVQTQFDSLYSCMMTHRSQGVRRDHYKKAHSDPNYVWTQNRMGRNITTVLLSLRYLSFKLFLEILFVQIFVISFPQGAQIGPQCMHTKLYNFRSESKFVYYPTALHRVQITLKTSTNITRYFYSRGPVRQVSCR